MNNPITITASVAVWLSNSEYGYKPDDLMAALERRDPVEVVNMLSFYGPTDKTTFSDCIRVGEADITVRLISRDEQTQMALASLNEKLEKLRAAYQQRQSEILAEISKLQAITYEAA